MYGAEDGVRTRDLNLGKVARYQLRHFRPCAPQQDRPIPQGRPDASRELLSKGSGAESQNRTGDTAIFSRVLYQLSYLGPST